MMKKIIYFNLIFLILFSCSRKKEYVRDIELLILSENISSKKNFMKSMDESIISDYKNFSGKTLRFSIKNNTENNILLRLKNEWNTYPGLLSKEGVDLDLEFLQIVETTHNDTLEVSRHNVLNFGNVEKEVKERIKYFENLNYYNSIFWYDENILINSNLIHLKSKESKYFEVYVNLPHSSTSYGSRHYYLDSIKNYNVSLKLISDTTDIKKYLTWSQLKNIEENNYKLFHGTIVSENSIPIEFVD